MSELNGKVAWVTGGGGGIGAAIVDELRQRGATVRTTDRDEAKGMDRCDMRDPDQIDYYARSLIATHGKLDILINNAGIQRRKQFVDFTEADFDDIFGVNVRGMFFASQAAARMMIETRCAGSIINISSVNATHAQPETVLYCASKGAVATMTRALAVAFGRHGIRVNAIAPGTIVTGLNQDRLSNQNTVEGVIQVTALGRLGMPQDVAPTAAFLASDGASFITGSTIAVHGGWTLQG